MTMSALFAEDPTSSLLEKTHSWHKIK